jgi:hypothetical protein
VLSGNTPMLGLVCFKFFASVLPFPFCFFRIGIEPINHEQCARPINITTGYGPGIQSSEIQRILALGGTWFNNGAIMGLP